MMLRPSNLLLLAPLLLSWTDDATPPKSPKPPFTIKIVALNDFHGNLQSPGTFGSNTSIPPSERPAVGGADYVAAHVAKVTRENPLNVVVGAGRHLIYEMALLHAVQIIAATEIAKQAPIHA
jgi:5'-nucleotidase